MGWSEQAACRGVDVEIFYSDEPGAMSQALQLCGGCPVRAHCLDTAMGCREFYGVWGGTPERHRQRLFRREDRARRREGRAA
jgi:WhiB family redox-sensing transcriptional regulator